MKHHPNRLPILVATAFAAVSAAAAELGGIYLFKAVWYTQTSDADPELLPQAQDPFDLRATAYLSEELLNDPDALLFVTGMTLRTPAGRLEGMDFNEGQGSFVHYAGAVTAQALNLRYGAGNYHFTLHSVITGDTSYTVPLAADDYPPAPRVTNFTAAQQIDPAQDFTLRWSEFTGGGEREIWLEIAVADTFETVFVAGPLEGDSTSAVIPADTLAQDMDYHATLVFTRYSHVSPDAVPASYAGFEAYTQLPMSTGGGSPAPPRFTGWRRLASGDLELTVESQAGQPLTLVAAEALDGAWTNLQTATPTGGTTTFVVPRAALGGRQFFRVRQG